MASSTFTGVSVQTPVTARVITVTSGNLFDIAARYLGDGTQWTRIARFNGMTDPFFTGVVTLKIPAINKSAGTDGILYS